MEDPTIVKIQAIAREAAKEYVKGFSEKEFDGHWQDLMEAGHIGKWIEVGFPDSDTQGHGFGAEEIIIPLSVAFIMVANNLSFLIQYLNIKSFEELEGKEESKDLIKFTKETFHHNKLITIDKNGRTKINEEISYTKHEFTIDDFLKWLFGLFIKS